mgnify:CR=1 FL=1
MKSDEEFIAGIYKKAEVYTEEKENKIRKVSISSRVMKMAAMIVVCVGLVSVANIVLHQENKHTTEDYGIALLSETGEQAIEPGVAFHRMGPAQEYATFKGIVESIEEQEKIVWIKLEFTEEMQDEALVAVRFDILEEIDTEICVGKKLIVSGVLGTYENEISKRFGSTQLTVNNLADVFLLVEEIGNYQNKNGEEYQ